MSHRGSDRSTRAPCVRTMIHTRVLQHSLLLAHYRANALPPQHQLEGERHHCAPAGGAARLRCVCVQGAKRRRAAGGALATRPLTCSAVGVHVVGSWLSVYGSSPLGKAFAAGTAPLRAPGRSQILRPQMHPKAGRKRRRRRFKDGAPDDGRERRGGDGGGDEQRAEEAAEAAELVPRAALAQDRAAFDRGGGARASSHTPRPMRECVPHRMVGV